MTLTPNQLNATDQIVALLENNGQILASVNKSEFTSMDEIVGLIYALAGKFMGLARLTVRNKTQGWSTVMPLAARRQTAPSYSRPTPRLHGRQYVIPFSN